MKFHKTLHSNALRGEFSPRSRNVLQTILLQRSGKIPCCIFPHTRANCMGNSVCCCVAWTYETWNGECGMCITLYVYTFQRFMYGGNCICCTRAHINACICNVMHYICAQTCVCFPHVHTYACLFSTLRNICAQFPRNGGKRAGKTAFHKRMYCIRLRTFPRACVPMRARACSCICARMRTFPPIRFPVNVCVCTCNAHGERSPRSHTFSFPVCVTWNVERMHGEIPPIRARVCVYYACAHYACVCACA